MAPPHVWLGPLKCWLEKLTTARVWSWFSPCVWGDAAGLVGVRSLLHGTVVGRWMVRNFWAQLTGETVKRAGLRRAREEGLEGLVPKESAFWL